MRIDGDFEDREGHQAPFTLRDSGNIRRSTSKVERRIKRTRDRADRLFETFDLPNDGVEVGPFVGGQFGMERVAIGADFKGAPAGWDQRERRDAIAEFEGLSRQTDGFRRIVSNRAILDSDFGFHLVLLPRHERSGMQKPVNPAAKSRKRVAGDGR